MSKSKSRKNRRKNIQRTRTIETLEKREMFSTAPWSGQIELETHVEPLTAVVASNPSEQVAVSLDDAGILNVVGTQEDDSIHVRENRRGQVIVESDGDEIFRTQRGTKVQQLRIDGHDGDDHIRNDTSIPSIVTGGDGRDRLIGGSGDDVLLGQKGRDRLNGRRGDDILIGGKGKDNLNGGPGRDSIDNTSPMSVLPGLPNNVMPLPSPSLPTEIDGEVKNPNKTDSKVPASEPETSPVGQNLTEDVLEESPQIPSDRTSTGPHTSQASGSSLTIANGQLLSNGVPTRLVGYGDYGMLSEKSFDYEQFFSKVSKHGINHVRVWMNYHWTGSLSPFAEDSNGKYDLTRYSKDFLNRLNDFVSSAKKHGIVVQVTLFDTVGFKDGSDLRWKSSPFNPSNNSNGFGDSSGSSTLSKLQNADRNSNEWKKIVRPLIKKS